MLRKGDAHPKYNHAAAKNKHRAIRKAKNNPSRMTTQYGFHNVTQSYSDGFETPQDRHSEVNSIIDVLCRLDRRDIETIDWFFDIEFCIPKEIPKHRHLAYYDKNKRMVMSGSQPNTVHPDFLQCNDYFRNLCVCHFHLSEIRLNQLNEWSVAVQMLENLQQKNYPVPNSQARQLYRHGQGPQSHLSVQHQSQPSVHQSQQYPNVLSMLTPPPSEPLHHLSVPPPQGHATSLMQVPQNYNELYRMMEEQKIMQNALQAASSRRAHHHRAN